jgi:aldehyde dehydrogenase
MELGGKSPLIFFPSVMDKVTLLNFVSFFFPLSFSHSFSPCLLSQEDNFLDKALEASVMFALNQGEVCTCPSRMLVHESIYEKFMKLVVERTKLIKIGHPLVPPPLLSSPLLCSTQLKA